MRTIAIIINAIVGYLVWVPPQVGRQVGVVGLHAAVDDAHGCGCCVCGYPVPVAWRLHLVKTVQVVARGTGAVCILLGYLEVWRCVHDICGGGAEAVWQSGLVCSSRTIGVSHCDRAATKDASLGCKAGVVWTMSSCKQSHPIRASCIWSDLPTLEGIQAGRVHNNPHAAQALWVCILLCM